jgi:hypothetical protein
MLLFSNMERAGFLPTFFSMHDPRSARDQLHESYIHGGCVPFKGFTLKGNDTASFRLHYPGDPPMKPVSHALLHGELIVLFEYDWLAIIQPDGSHIICRVD